MTHTDRFMRTSIKRRFSLDTLLQISRLMKDFSETEAELRFQYLNRVLESTRSEQEFCTKVFGSAGTSEKASQAD